MILLHLYILPPWFHESSIFLSLVVFIFLYFIFVYLFFVHSPDLAIPFPSPADQPKLPPFININFLWSLALADFRRERNHCSVWHEVILMLILLKVVFRNDKKTFSLKWTSKNHLLSCVIRDLIPLRIFPFLLVTSCKITRNPEEPNAFFFRHL